MIKNKTTKHSIHKIEYKLAGFFGYRRNIIVPNISWGLSNIGHECDVLVLSPSNYAMEVEIKRSWQDLKADKFKTHGHLSNKIKKLWFCLPENWDLEAARQHIPERSGILVYNERCNITVCKEALTNKHCKKFTEEERQQLLRLAHMRVWSMKRNMK